MTSTLTIDKAGRIVLPKPIRQELHIEPGDTFEVETQGDEIKLRPVRRQARVWKKRGVWVFSTGEPTTAESVNELIQETRNERDAWNRGSGS
jgi:AbrB family looped-hinge helix DNA binding protein